MSKYAELDELILGKLNATDPTPFYKIHHYEGGKSCFDGRVFTLCDCMAKCKGEGFRVLDRRLQALRKAGKIKSIPGKGWVKLTEDKK